MSDSIPPVYIQREILNILHVKPLLRFRSVSKTWKSIIDTHFIKHYSGPDHLLVQARDLDDNRTTIYVAFADDHTFPKHKLSLPIPPSLKDLDYCFNIGSSRGLLCMHTFNSSYNGFVVWNPSIGKVVSIQGGMYGTVVGFGVCRETDDPKIVKIVYTGTEGENNFKSRVEVFALSTGAWRSSYGGSDLTNEIIDRLHFISKTGIEIDGYHYWLARDRFTYKGASMIISFDMTSEEFRQVGKSLAVFVATKDGRGELSFECHASMMEYGLPKLFTKLFTIAPTIYDLHVLGGLEKFF
ncbi:putative F-box protein At3g16210 [Bidens hawaiensis]|uniref:putative F-box protein At3g16210 n=1 Tax=Bidens hawaiensis TaxID=980011 RepID=UPI0040490357